MFEKVDKVTTVNATFQPEVYRVVEAYTCPEYTLALNLLTIVSQCHTGMDKNIKTFYKV